MTRTLTIADTRPNGLQGRAVGLRAAGIIVPIVVLFVP
jgi:hypothetical protein